MNSPTVFSALLPGDRFCFRHVFVGREWIKTGIYSFTSAEEFEDARCTIRKEELITSDFQVWRRGSAPPRPVASGATRSDAVDAVV